MLNDIYQALDPVAFTVGPFSVRWYALAYLVGFVIVAFMFWHVGKRWKVKITGDDLLTILACVMVGIVFGARVGYVLSYGNGYYLEHPDQILAFSNGGMSFHGGLVGVMIGGLVAAKFTKIPFLTLADLGAIAAPPCLFLGRCANFVNGELWGAVTDLPWGVVFGGSAGMLPRHPSQLYEALLEGLLLFIVLYALARKVPPKPQGTFLGVFMAGYGVCRFALEFVRQPDAQLGYLFGGWLTMGMVLSVPLIIAGVGLLLWAGKTRKPQSGAPVQLVPTQMSMQAEGSAAVSVTECVADQVVQGPASLAAQCCSERADRSPADSSTETGSNLTEELAVGATEELVAGATNQQAENQTKEQADA